MALPSSGPLSIGAIRTELGSGSGSLRTLSAAAGKSTPDSMSEFYGYSAFTPPSINYSGSPYSATGTGTVDNPYIITLSASSMNFVEECYEEEGFCIYRYETFHNGTGFQFICQDAGQYRVYSDLIGGSVSNMSGVPNGTGFSSWIPNGWNSGTPLGFSIDSDSADTFAAMVAAPERNKSLTTNFNVGDVIIGMSVIVQRFYGPPTFNNVVFRMKFEKV